MARTPKLKPVETPTGWRLNVPAALSDTGKRRQLFFPNPTKANLEAERIKGMVKKWGTVGRSISATLAEDAAKAAGILKGHNISLASLASEYVQRADRKAGSVRLSEAFAAHREHSSKYLAERTQEEIRQTHRRFLENHPDCLICEITPESIKAALEAWCPTRTTFNTRRRYLSTTFTYAVEEGKWLDHNPVSKVKPIRKPSDKPTRQARRKMLKTAKADIDTLTPAEASAMFAACRDLSEEPDIPKTYAKTDASDMVPTVALLLFAGLRPDDRDGEIGFLRWEDIDLKNKRLVVAEYASKTGLRRTVHLSDNCIDWLSRTPVKDRKGTIVPNGWSRKLKAIKFLALEKRAKARQDVTRKSFCTYKVRGGASEGEVSREMGNSVEVLKKHYLAQLRTEAEAEAYWRISPSNPAGLASVREAG